MRQLGRLDVSARSYWDGECCRSLIIFCQFPAEPLFRVISNTKCVSVPSGFRGLLIFDQMIAIFEKSSLAVQGANRIAAVVRPDGKGAL